MYGRVFSEDHRNKISLALKSRQHFSEEEKKIRKRLCEARRRAQMSGSGGTVLPDEWEMMKWVYDFTCPSCLRKEPLVRLTIDHINPLSRGGKNELINVQPLCVSCNSGKRDRHTTCYPLPKIYTKYDE
jgi:5-methylcytosine-specific restriction endonuclease McrA